MTALRLDVTNVTTNVTTTVTFPVGTDEVAAAYIARKGSTCAMTEALVKDEARGEWIPANDFPFVDFPLAYAALYPTCEHGLSLNLCAGPGHYAMDDPRDF